MRKVIASSNGIAKAIVEEREVVELIPVNDSYSLVVGITASNRKILAPVHGKFEPWVNEVHPNLTRDEWEEAMEIRESMMALVTVHGDALFIIDADDSDFFVSTLGREVDLLGTEFSNEDFANVIRERFGVEVYS